MAADTAPTDQHCTFGAGSPRTGSLRVISIVTITYVLMLLFVWGIFATTSGMGWETAPAVRSESSPGWAGFLYQPDPMRIQTYTFYHFAYVFGEAIGMRGSFVPYQITYAMLWLARSILVFLIFRKILPGAPLLAFSIGALLLVHASDGTLQWPGHLGQFGGFLWLLLACYLLISAFQRATVGRAAAYITGACPFLYMCLWTYEGPLCVILAAPAVFAFLLRLKPAWRSALVAGVWYVMPALYLYLSWKHYVSAGGQAYQRGLMRTDFSAVALLSDWIFNIRYSLSFWAWTPADSHMEPTLISALAAGAAVTFLFGGLTIVWMVRGIRSEEASGNNRQLWRILGAGFVVLALSFPVFLLLSTARVPWRTHLLAGIGAAIVLAAAVALAAQLAPTRKLRPVLSVILAVPIIWVGASRTIQHGGYHKSRWDPHLVAMKALLRAAPAVRDGTVIVMTNVPRVRDPFGEDYWFNFALRLAYPRIAVAGVFYYEDKAPGSGNNLLLRSGGWDYLPGGVAAPMILSAPADRTIIMEYRPSGPAKVLPEIPPFVCDGSCPASYGPQERIITGPPAPEALRRYGPL